jgi:hypothetical protein
METVSLSAFVFIEHANEMQRELMFGRAQRAKIDGLQTNCQNRSSRRHATAGTKRDLTLFTL